MIYLIMYDIATDSIRTKLAKMLIAEGYERLQYSVFTGLGDPGSNKPLWNKITGILTGEPDAKFYTIGFPEKYFEKIKFIGNFALDTDYLIGKKRSLII